MRTHLLEQDKQNQVEASNHCCAGHAHVGGVKDKDENDTSLPEMQPGVQSQRNP